MMENYLVCPTYFFFTKQNAFMKYFTQKKMKFTFSHNKKQKTKKVLFSFSECPISQCGVCEFMSFPSIYCEFQGYSSCITGGDDWCLSSVLLLCF